MQPRHPLRDGLGLGSALRCTGQSARHTVLLATQETSVALRHLVLMKAYVRHDEWWKEQ
jgi:hypothetical protein